MSNEIVLGSGKLYLASYTAGAAISALSTYCTSGNQVGLIKGGASVEYKPSTYEVKDDLFVVNKRFIVSETASLKSGIITWDIETLNKIISNANYTSSGTGASEVKQLKLGGNGAREMDKFIVVFEHKLTSGKVLRVGLVGTSDDGLSLAFQPDKETQVDATFNACSNDSDGCLLIIEEAAA